MVKDFLISRYRAIKYRTPRAWFLRSILDDQKAISLMLAGDPVRHGSFLLAIREIEKRRIEGSFAECGVFAGMTSKFIHSLAPDKTYYLFDTFEGFPTTDLETAEDKRFQDTSVDTVKRNIGDLQNIVFKKGYFPDTAVGLEEEVFSLVILDFDLYKPTLAGLEFFYPRMSPGGYIFVHDYNSPESNFAVSRAVDAFMAGKPGGASGIPDAYGSVIIRK